MKEYYPPPPREEREDDDEDLLEIEEQERIADPDEELQIHFTQNLKRATSVMKGNRHRVEVEELAHIIVEVEVQADSELLFKNEREVLDLLPFKFDLNRQNMLEAEESLDSFEEHTSRSTSRNSYVIPEALQSAIDSAESTADTLMQVSDELMDTKNPVISDVVTELEAFTTSETAQQPYESIVSQTKARSGSNTKIPQFRDRMDADGPGTPPSKTKPKPRIEIVTRVWSPTHSPLPTTLTNDSQIPTSARPNKPRKGSWGRIKDLVPKVAEGGNRLQGYGGEQMKRPTELQRRISKSNSPRASSFDNLNTETLASGKVAALKQAFNESVKNENKKSGSADAIDTGKSLVKERMKLFQN